MSEENRIILKCADSQYEHAYEAYEKLVELKKNLVKASFLGMGISRFISIVDGFIGRKVRELEKILEVTFYIQQNNIQEGK